MKKVSHYFEGAKSSLIEVRFPDYHIKRMAPMGKGPEVASALLRFPTRPFHKSIKWNMEVVIPGLYYSILKGDLNFRPTNYT